MDFIDKIKLFFSENPARLKLLIITALVLLIPITVLAALTVQNLRQRAGGTGVQIVDAGGNFLSTTSNTSVYLRINLPENWVSLGMKRNDLVKQAYAQTICGDIICSIGETCQTINEGGGIVSGICLPGTQTPTLIPTAVPTPIPTKTPTPTPTSSVPVQNSGIQCGTITCDSTYYVCGQFQDPNSEKITYYCAPKSSLSTATPTPVPTNTPTPATSPTTIPALIISPTSGPTPTPIPNVLQAIYIENKDSDGSSNGSEPLRITSGLESYINTQVPWKLNDLLPSQNQATRLVQVTFLGSQGTVALTGTVTLIRATTPTEVLSRVEVSMNCNNGLAQISVKQSCYLSALAYDTANFPISRNVSYEWGISSIESIGTLTSTQNNITTFYAQNVGSGVIWVMVRQGDKQVQKSVVIQVENFASSGNTDSGSPTATPIPPTPTATPTPTPTNIPANPIVQNSPTPTPTPLPYCYLKSKGDADCDNKITSADGVNETGSGIWQREFVSELSGIVTQKQSDFNKDGIINIVDFNIWLTSFADSSLPH